MRQPPAHARHPRPTAAHRTALALLAGAAALLGPVLTAPAAAAHDVLVGSEPADGAVLEVPPADVVLTFSAEQGALGAEVLVTGPDGSDWTSGDAVVAGTTVTQPLRPGMPNGAYRVAWRSVAADGHPVTGELGFEVSAPEPTPSPSATPRPTGDDATEGDEGPTAQPTDETTELPAEPVAVAPSGSGGVPPWLVAGPVAALALVAAGVLVARRRRAARD